MFLRSFIICCYLVTVYWASTHFPSLRMVFYPTLGAFSFLFMSRISEMREVRRIIVGAMISVILGSVLYGINPGAISFFATAIITILLIQFFKWNAAPILAVSFIPYFAHPNPIWALPIAVLASLLGLLLPLVLINRLEQSEWVAKRLTQAKELLRLKNITTYKNGARHKA